MAEEAELLVRAVMEDSVREYKRSQEAQWMGMEEMLALTAAGDVYVPEQDVKEVKEEATEERVWTSWSPLPPPPQQEPASRPAPIMMDYLIKLFMF